MPLVLALLASMLAGTYVGFGKVTCKLCCSCLQVEVIMPATWNVKESHDVALQLQHKVCHKHLACPSFVPSASGRGLRCHHGQRLMLGEQ